MKKGIAWLCMVLGLSVMINPVVYAADPPYKLPEEESETTQAVTDEDQDSEADDKSEEDDVYTLILSVEEAVEYGVAHNRDLQLLDIQYQLANLSLSNATRTAKDLDQAESSISSAETTLASKKAVLLDAENTLEAAKELYEKGITPVDIPLTDNKGDAVTDSEGNAVILIPLGSNIKEAVTEIVEATIIASKHSEIVAVYESVIRTNSEMDEVQKASATAALENDIAPFDLPITEEVTISQGVNLTAFITTMVEADTSDEKLSAISDSVAKINGSIEEGLDEKQDALDESIIAISEAYAILEGNRALYSSSMKDASRETEAKLGYSSTIELEVDDLKNLMTTMAEVNLSLTDYAQDIYRNQIAMLIRKNYYDALYAEKALALKEKAMERAETQFNMVSLSYENGMKAKDDYILANMYYQGTIMANRLAEAEYNNAISELKKTIGAKAEWQVELIDPLEVEVTEEDLETALNYGLTNRLEIQQCLGKLMLCELNEEIIDDMAITTKYKYKETESDVLVDQAEVALEKYKEQVTAEVNQSYETMMATADMVKTSENLIEEAEEVVAIAQLKYDQGFGVDNSLLNSMNLQGTSGTILELIAAQEKLAEVEATVANVRYNYVMARCKFYNDAGMLKD